MTEEQFIYEILEKYGTAAQKLAFDLTNKKGGKVDFIKLIRTKDDFGVMLNDKAYLYSNYNIIKCLDEMYREAGTSWEFISKKFNGVPQEKWIHDYKIPDDKYEEIKQKYIQFGRKLQHHLDNFAPTVTF